MFKSMQLADVFAPMNYVFSTSTTDFHMTELNPVRKTQLESLLSENFKIEEIELS